MYQISKEGKNSWNFQTLKLIQKMKMISIQIKPTTLVSTGGPLDMRILEPVKTRVSGKWHSENQKVVIQYMHDFSLVCEIKITFAAICLLINYYMLYNL